MCRRRQDLEKVVAGGEKEPTWGLIGRECYSYRKSGPGIQVWGMVHFLGWKEGRICLREAHFLLGLCPIAPARACSWR